jgi:hypothetical protein
MTINEYIHLHDRDLKAFSSVLLPSWHVAQNRLRNVTCYMNEPCTLVVLLSDQDNAFEIQKLIDPQLPTRRVWFGNLSDSYLELDDEDFAP